MVCTHNKRVSMGPSPYTYNLVHHNTSFHYSALSPSSTSQSDLSGFVCNIGPSYRDELFTKKYYGQDLERDSVFIPIQFPPSPPPTNSQPKRSVPLPSLHTSIDPGSSSQHFGGILDSPPLMKHVALGCHAPISPPPTLPTPTLDLPPTENELASMTEHDDFSLPLISISSPSTLPEQDDAAHHLLSPLSPEWVTNRISPHLPSSSSFDDSVLLHENYPSPSGMFQYRLDSHDRHSPLSRPILPLLDIPGLQYSPGFPWDQQSPSSAMDTELDELDNLSTPISSPPSPFMSKPDLDSDILFDNYEDNQYTFFPNSPSIHHIQLLPSPDDDMSDITPTYSSPSRRSFTSLPKLDLDESDDVFSSVPSPTPSLLTLPGAEPDDDLLPADLAISSEPPDMALPSYGLNESRSLLLLDDPNDVPTPRSPSPEPFDLDPALLERCTDPEVQHLNELRQKAQNAERAARTLETKMLDQGTVHMRWDARRSRKKEKDRVREISTMLRLKLAEKGLGVDDGTEGMEKSKSPRKHSKKKSAISSMAQLVAKMMLRRNDTCRSLANRKAPLTPKPFTSSPLTRRTALPDEEDEEDEPDGYVVGRKEAQWSSPSWSYPTEPEHF